MNSRASVIKYVVLSFACFLLSGTAPAYAIRLTSVTLLHELQHDFRQPSDVSVSDGGLVYVVDGVNNRIQVFDQAGAYQFSFGGKGRAKGQFLFPMGIALDRAGRVYVADSGNGRVQVFTPTGTFLSAIDMPPGDKPADPTDTAIDDSRGLLYVVDNDNHRILQFDLESRRLLESFGTPGEGKRQFRYPFLITLDSDGYLYIVDVINTRVQVLSPDGKFVSYIGGWGVEKGEFFRPKGIAVDRQGRAFVSDSYLCVVQVFRGNGSFYSALTDPGGQKVKKFTTPTGIFIDSNDRLYVVEMFANRVSVYHIEGDTE